MSEDGLQKAARRLEERGGARVSLSDVVRSAGSAGHGAAFLFLMIPNVTIIPSVPLLPFVVGVPAMLMLIAMMRGHPPHIPGRMGRWSVTAVVAARCLRTLRMLSVVGREGRAASVLEHPLGNLGICTMGLLMTFATCLPLPMLNVPVALSTLLLGMGLARRDGAVCLIAVVAGMASLVFMAWGVSQLAEAIMLWSPEALPTEDISR